MRNIEIVIADCGTAPMPSSVSIPKSIYNAAIRFPGGAPFVRGEKFYFSVVARHPRTKRRSRR